MIRCWPRVLLLPALIALLLSLGIPAACWAIFPPPVKDDGKFFTKDGLDRANKKIREIYEKYKKDVVVETLEKLTADQQKKFDDDPERFFPRLCLDRSRELGLNGVYILIVKKPRRLQMHMDPETQKKAFTTASRKVAYEKITAEFRDGNFDDGLLAGLSAIDAAFKANLAPEPKTKSSKD